ncbi:MAG TPA: protease, partial [Erythrobacter sp.]|nr:protease [Erythrobacter sp.]
AARGVVRVVIVGERDGELFPISHGTGFAVTGNTVVTNAHVVRDALRDEGMQIGIVPTGGGEAVYGRIIAVLARNDLALIRITGDLRLPPLALAGGMPPDSGEVTSVGYPMNVDRAQGLDISDIFRSQPPVKSRGFISGARPSRQFDTILHTAPIARGNSGGPLLDLCGRVVGVNSFGADNDGGDAEFFFAVSNRELVPFL